MKIMIKKLFFLALIGLHFFSESYGQTTVGGTPTNVDKNVSNNSLNGNSCNADLFTGTVNVNIPIYAYKVDGLDLGVSLNYATNGIQVDQLASNVGLGWNLNAGGYITRKVNGIEDEITHPGIGPLLQSNLGWYFTTRQTFGSWNIGQTYGGTQASGVEQEPDVFSVNVGGKSFDFMIAFTPSDITTTVISDNRNVHIDVLMDNNVVPSKITDTSVAMSKTTSVMSFKIVDEEGNQFFFDRGDYEYQPYDDDTDNLHYTFYPVDKWNITKIITTSGAEVDYQYNYYTLVNYPNYNDVEITEQKNYIYPLDHSTDLPGGISVKKNVAKSWQGTLSQIKEIDYPNGTKVNFSAGADPTTMRRDLALTWAIDSIIIQSKYDNNLWHHLTYRLNHAYFTQDPNNPELSYGTADNIDERNYRLKLKSIDKIGSDNVTTESYYKFSYNSLLLPPRLSASQDCYGYYNGATPVLSASFTGTSTPTTDITSYMASAGFSNLAVPYHSFQYSTSSGFFSAGVYNISYGTSRASNVSFAQACLLNKVVNSLGGETDLYYKAHVLTNPVTQINGVSTNYFLQGQYGTLTSDISFDGTGLNAPSDLDFTNVSDGVCIDYIVNSDGIDVDNTTTTRYTFTNGLRFFAGGYTWYPTMIAAPYTTNTNYDWQERIYTNRIISPQDFINGSNHGYSDVNVITYGYNTEIISNKHTHFTNIIEAPNEVDSIVIDKPGQTYNKKIFHTSPALLSRLMWFGGLVHHTSPEFIFYKNLVGLPIETDDYDKNNNLMSQTVNRYNISESSTPFSYPIYRYYNVTKGGDYHVYDSYNPFVASVPLLKSALTTTYIGGSTRGFYKWYFYDQWDNIYLEQWNDSKGDSYTNSYTNEYIPISPAPKSIFRVTASYKSKLINGWYYNVSGQSAGWGYNPANNVTSATLGNFKFLQAGILKILKTDNNTYTDWKYYTTFDNHNNVLETAYQGMQVYNSSVWDNRIGEKVASVTNSRYTDMAYSSFEGPFLSGFDYNKGNWSFNSGNVVYDPASKPPTGKYYYNVTSAITGINPLVSGKLYYLSFWMQGTPYVQITGRYPASVAVTAQNTINGWTLYTCYITGNGNPISVGSVGTAKLDELRVYPANASMETFTYEPLFGVSSHCDDRNNITYFEYDAMGTQTVTRDINGNIISLTKETKQSTDN